MPNTNFSLHPNNFDRNSKPTDDFFNYVNAKWIHDNPIPPEEARWGSFYALRTDVEKQLKAIFEGIAAKPDAELSDNARKVRDFYATGMDVEKRKHQKTAPLAALIASVDAITNVNDAVRVIGKLHRAGVSALWDIGVDQDLKQSEIMALYFSQGGLGLPDRDYYVNDDEKSIEIRMKYTKHIEGLFSVVEFTGDGGAAKAIMETETRLARISWTRVELRDVEKQYNKMTPTELSASTPHIDWNIYFAAIAVPVPAYAIVCQPTFMQEADAWLASVPLEDVKTYLKWHIVNGLANFLDEDSEKKIFDFYGRTFAGTTEMKPQWRRVLGVVNAMLDEAVGELYVERHFSATAKEKIRVLVEHLIVAYHARIEKLNWMSQETKEKAAAKLAAITKKLGYPDAWKDIGALTIGTSSYVENYMSAHAFEFARSMKKIAQPVDRKEWHAAPQIVNAFYSPIMNEILFPAAFLQPPFFDAALDDAVNYGAIGMAIGHELTHGFDDQGALFDLHGNLQNWWLPEDKERFDKQTAHLADQFDAYEPLPGLHVNGKLTLGENIADLGGLLIAYDGLQLALAESATVAGAGGAQLIDGLTPEQRFFVAYAISELGVAREEALRLQVQTDPHSPSIYRVNGPLSNMTEFYEAFGVKEGDALYRNPEDRVNIW